MSFSRKLKRQKVRDNCRGRITYPKCHAKLVEKTGYGLVCMECGWTKLAVNTGEQHE